MPEVAVPASIVSDCSADVSTTLAQFLNSVPDGTTVNFAAGGCYRVEREMDLTAKTGVVLDGNGATLVRTQPTPGVLRYPKSNGFLRLLQWTNGGVRQLNIQGINLVSDLQDLRPAYGAWDQSMEFDAGINVRGGSRPRSCRTSRSTAPSVTASRSRGGGATRQPTLQSGT